MKNTLERDEPLLAKDMRVGDFQILALLGRGGMGEVYLAQDIIRDHLVALKYIRRAVVESHGIERFLEEARAIASFNHPHVVTLYAVGQHDGRPYLALEYIEGASLRARLADGPLPMLGALHCCRAVAEVIAAAHRCNLIHADLKPAKILISSDGRVRISDFGFARAALNMMQGTQGYIAPECWRGESLTGAADIWALGVMLYEMIVGVRPVPPSPPRPPLKLAFLPEVPWARLVRDCLALEPAHRPTAEEMQRRLSLLLDQYAAKR